MNSFDFEEELGKVDFLEAPNGVPPEAAAFSMKDNQDKFVGGTGDATEKQRGSLAEARSKILKFTDNEYALGMQATKDRILPTARFKTPDGKQSIDMVGTSHLHQLPTQEAKRVMVDQLDGKIQGYLDVTASDPSKRLFMIEGGHMAGTTLQEQTEALSQMAPKILQENNITTKQEAEEKFGEMGTVLFAAVKEGVPIVSPEPSEEEIMQKQREAGIPEPDIALKQAIFQIDQHIHRGQFKDEKRFAPNEVYSALATACEQSGWQKDLLEQTKAKLTGNADMDQQVMKGFVDQVLPQLNARMEENEVGFNLVNPDYSWAFDPSDKQTYDRLMAPYSEVSVFNKMSNIANNFRNERILDGIHEAVAEGKSPFVVYGQGHTVQLEPAVSALYQKTS